MNPNKRSKLILIGTLRRIAKGEVPADKVQLQAYLALGGRIEDGKMIDLKTI